MKKSFTLKSSKSKPLNGIINIPSDKSISIRSLIISSCCIGNTKIFNLLESDDVICTLHILKKLGIQIYKKNNHYEVFGKGGFFSNPTSNLDFGNSGTGVRLMAGLLGTSSINATLIGDKSLTSRPMKRIIEPLKQMNVNLKSTNGYLPIQINDQKKIFRPSKHILEIGSAQVKSCILLAALNIKGTLEIIEKIPSRDHTEIMLKYLGADLKKKKNTISFTNPNFLKPKDITIPGDFSSAAFIIIAVLLSQNSNVKIKNVGLNYFRIGLLDVLKKMKASINISNNNKINGELIGDIEVKSSNLISTNVSKKISPRLIDEYPILFVAASFAKGVSEFKGLGELKVKESNRLVAMAESLKAAGVKLSLGADSIKIFGQKKHHGGNLVVTQSDHRIAMSMLVFGLFSENPVIVDDMKMIKTSFPKFKEIFEKLGAQIEFFQKP
ncbi:MAG: 3-phosphoshikimate 1-carboxyvinyltransferase [Alphaproteobacteria bacterium]